MTRAPTTAALFVLVLWAAKAIATLSLAATAETAASSSSSPSQVRCFSGITTLSGTLGDANSPNNPCPGGYCAADWQLAFDAANGGSVKRFQLLIGPHQIDLASLHDGASVQQIECSTRASNSDDMTEQEEEEVVFVVRSGFQSGAATFEWRYRASAAVNCDTVRTHAVTDGFLGMTLSVVVLNVGSWSSANADVQPEFALSAFETDCAAIAFDVPTLDHYCYRFGNVALTPRGNDPYVGTFCAVGQPCAATLAFCLDTATFTQVSRISVALNDQYCVMLGEEHSAPAQQCVGQSAALMVATVDTPGVTLTFAASNDGDAAAAAVDICADNLERATTALSLDIIVGGETRYYGLVEGVDMAAHRIGFPPLSADSPCDESHFWVVHHRPHQDSGSAEPSSSSVSVENTCIDYCLHGLLSTETPCAINGVAHAPCALTYDIDLTMCSDGGNTVHSFNMNNAADGELLISLDSSTAVAACDFFVASLSFGIGNTDSLLGEPTRITWNVPPAATTDDFNCSADMWYRLPEMTLPASGFFISSPALETFASVLTDTNNSLAESLCAEPATLPTPAPSTSTPSPSADPDALTPSPTLEPTQEPAPSTLPALPTPSSSPPSTPCTLRCLRSGTGYWKNSPKASGAWLTLPEPRSLCGFDYRLLIDPSNKEVKKAIASKTLREALRLVAILDLNLHANLLNDSNGESCAKESAIERLPLAVQTAYAGIRMRYANATLCQPQTFSAFDDDDDDDAESAEATAATVLEQWVAALAAFLDTDGGGSGTNPVGLLDCNVLDAASMIGGGGGNSWEDVKYKRAIEPVHVCTTKLSGFNNTCLSVFSYRNPNDEYAFIGVGQRNKLLADGDNVVRRTLGCVAPTSYFEGSTGPEDLGNGTFAVLWFCKQYKSRHLAWRLGTHVSNSQAPAPQNHGWVYRRADAYWLVDTCQRSTIDYWLNFACSI